MVQHITEALLELLTLAVDTSKLTKEIRRINLSVPTRVLAIMDGEQILDYLTKPTRSGRSGGRVRVACLTGVAACLLIVGIESETFLRHVFQITPIVIVLAFAVRRQRWTAPAALGLFGCWAFFMGLIWLYLAGLQTFFTGNFTLVEIALTILIGGFSMVGIVASRGAEPTIGRARRILLSMTFAALQLAVMWLSLFGHRFAAILSGA